MLATSDMKQLPIKKFLRSCLSYKMLCIYMYLSSCRNFKTYKRFSYHVHLYPIYSSLKQTPVNASLTGGGTDISKLSVCWEFIPVKQHDDTRNVCTTCAAHSEVGSALQTTTQLNYLCNSVTKLNPSHYTHLQIYTTSCSQGGLG